MYRVYLINGSLTEIFLYNTEYTLSKTTKMFMFVFFVAERKSRIRSSQAVFGRLIDKLWPGGMLWLVFVMCVCVSVLLVCVQSQG